MSSTPTCPYCGSIKVLELPDINGSRLRASEPRKEAEKGEVAVYRCLVCGKDF